MRNQVTIAAVSFVLGLLVVTQLRAQASGSGLGGMSSQDLTVFVANLNSGIDQRRQEIAALQRDLATLSANQDRGVVSLGQVRDELSVHPRLRRPGAGRRAKVTVTVDGPIDGPTLEDLINELRGAGAEAIAIDRSASSPGRRSSAARARSRSRARGSTRRSMCPAIGGARP